jgi:putative ABC transport system permease protein
MSLGRRWRAHQGWYTLVGLLCLVATLLVTAAPRVVNRYTDQGLREWIASLSYAARDVSYVAGGVNEPPPPDRAAAVLEALRDAMAPPLRDRLGRAWYATQAGGVATGPEVARRQAEVGVDTFLLALRDQSGAAEAVRLVDGQWPRNVTVSDQVAAAVSADVARTFGLRVGSTVDITAATAGASPVHVQIVGVFEPLDPDDPVWAEEPEVLYATAPIGIDPPVPWSGVLLTDTAGMSRARLTLGVPSMTWRFRIDESTITTADLPAVIEAVHDARTQTVIRATTVTALDARLVDFTRTEASARALVSMVQSGLAATLFGLIVLAALAAAERRRDELALLRARGAGLPGLGARLLAESLPVVAVAVALGYALSALVPGRPGGAGWLAAAFGLGAALTTCIPAVLAARRVTATVARADLARPRIAPGRTTAEATVVVLAVAGVPLLRQRGLGHDTDIYFSLLPVLVGVAAAVLAVRLLPYPVRLLTAAFARARGAVAFLGLASVGRASATSGGPVLVLVVAVSVSALCAAAANGLATARDRVAEIHVPGDAIVAGGRFPHSATDEIAAVPGVTAVAPIAVDRNHPLLDERDAWLMTGVTIVVVDAPALDRVVRTAGRSWRVPDPLLAGPDGDGPVPAVVSPDVAAALDPADGVGRLLLHGRTFPFTTAAVAERFPGLTGDAPFVVLSWSALPSVVARGVAPTGFALAGEGVDVAAVSGLAESIQRAWVSERLGRPYEGRLELRALTYDQARADLERAGIEPALDFTFAMGVGAGLLFALLAVGFAVATGARARGQSLSRLRTMGLTVGQGRALLAWELVPLIVFGAVVGSAVGGALPMLLGPALGLSAFTDGGPVAFGFDPTLPGLTLGLVVLALGLSIVVEASLNRRAGLGGVLRVGRES